MIPLVNVQFVQIGPLAVVLQERPRAKTKQAMGFRSRQLGAENKIEPILRVSSLYNFEQTWQHVASIYMFMVSSGFSTSEIPFVDFGTNSGVRKKQLNYKEFAQHSKWFRSFTHDFI